MAGIKATRIVVRLHHWLPTERNLFRIKVFEDIRLNDSVAGQMTFSRVCLHNWKYVTSALLNVRKRQRPAWLYAEDRDFGTAVYFDT